MSWIKMRADLPGDPAVIKLCRITGLNKFEVVGRLFTFWVWADANSVDGKLDMVTIEDVDNLLGGDRFADALIKIGWLLKKRFALEIPNFARHNGASAKSRSLKTQRQARWRASKTVDDTASTHVDDLAPTREEKRRVVQKHGLPTPNIVGKSAAETEKPKTVSENFQSEKPHTDGLPREWWKDDARTDAAGRALQLPAKAGESYPDYRTRLFALIAQRNRGNAPAAAPAPVAPRAPPAAAPRVRRPPEQILQGILDAAKKQQHRPP